ncbi:MAG: peptide deformylase [Myxococcota bacterium]|nr:peptide deformylase [Myxococcota bacterium]
MALRTVLTWPDERLRTIASEIMHIDDDTRLLVRDMFDTMYAEEGVGLAATQIGVALRLIVVDCSAERERPLALINPTIVHGEGQVLWPEGCLSLPGVTADVERFESIIVEYFDPSGHARRLETTGLEAVCIQHEVDHLDGQMYIDRLAELERKATLMAYDDAGMGSEVGD